MSMRVCHFFLQSFITIKCSQLAVINCETIQNPKNEIIPNQTKKKDQNEPTVLNVRQPSLTLSHLEWYRHLYRLQRVCSPPKEGNFHWPAVADLRTLPTLREFLTWQGNIMTFNMQWELWEQSQDCIMIICWNQRLWNVWLIWLILWLVIWLMQKSSKTNDWWEGKWCGSFTIYDMIDWWL